MTTMNESIVFIVDDDLAVRESLSILLGTSDYLTESYPSGQAFLDAYDGLKTGCLLLDINMPGMNGLELRRILNERQFFIPTIIITGYGDIPTAVKAMQLGAVDFVEKPYSEDLIIEKIELAMSHNGNNDDQNIAIAEIRELHSTLTGREKEVFTELVKGYQNKIIARNLEISPRTVEIHRANVLTKLKAPNLAQLIRMAILAGISG
jgi:two-component system response regulator FixJ